jgi:hypothetical protein
MYAEHPEKETLDQLQKPAKIFFWGLALKELQGVLLILALLISGGAYLVTWPFAGKSRELLLKHQARNEILWSQKSVEWGKFYLKEHIKLFSRDFLFQKEVINFVKERLIELQKKLEVLDTNEANSLHASFLKEMRRYLKDPRQLKKTFNERIWGDWETRKKSLSKEEQALQEMMGFPGSADGRFREEGLEEIGIQIAKLQYALEVLDMPRLNLPSGRIRELVAQTKRLWADFIREVEEWKPAQSEPPRVESWQTASAQEVEPGTQASPDSSALREAAAGDSL